MKIKSKNKRRAVFLLAGLIVLLTGFIVSQVSATEELKTKEGRFYDQNVQAFSQSARFLNSLEKSNWQNEYISEKTDADFSFNALGAKWHGSIPRGADVSIYARAFNTLGSGWELLPAPEDADLLDQGSEHYTDPLFFNEAKHFQYKIVVRPNQDFVWPEINDIEIIYLNTEQTTNWSRVTSFKGLFGKRAQADSGLKIISREEWGADESYRLNSQGKELWPPAHETVQKFVIHHTAGSNGGDKPAASVRGVYYWHAIVRGWGDIGYNFLIDGKGNIYEGRHGGDGVIGAHTFNDVTGINYNEGSVGISALGCYDTSKNKNGDPACAKKNTVNKKIQDALSNLIAEKAYLHGIPPQGESMFIDQKTPNIIGHSDLDYTLCPGNRIKDKYKTIRVAAQKQFLALGGGKMKYASEFVSHGIVPATFLGDQGNAEVMFKNAGTETWDKSKMVLKTYDLKDKVNQYKDTTWSDDYGKFKFEEKKVETDQEATFKFTLSTPKNPGLYKQIYKLFYDGEQIAGGKFSLNTRADSLYQAQLIKHNIPVAMLNLWRIPITVQFKNTGVATWNRGLVLSAYDLGQEASRFSDYTWESSVGRFELKEKEVGPGETGTFKFYIDAPYHLGVYQNIFQLEIPGHDDVIVQNGEIPLLTRVDG